MSRLFRSAALLVTVLLAAPALAQSRGGAPGRFDFYVLSLSWSATFCDLTGRSRGSAQCDAGRNPGFVVHGLWPQNEQGYPSFCGSGGRNPSRANIDEALRVMPDAGLARYEWRKHGVCSGSSPSGYFSDVAKARGKVVIPPAFTAPRASARWSVMEIERSFSAVNPGLRPDMIAVTCKRGMLEEVRVCMTRDLRGFRPCAEVDRDSCRARDVIVPSAL
jgi:ribonuclease T2